MHKSVRKMEVKDLPHVMSIVKTYEHDEYVDWIEVSDNVLLVCEEDNEIVGFCVCFVMSIERALLDIMVHDSYKILTKLRGELDGQLISKGIKYLADITSEETNIHQSMVFQVIE